MTSIVGKPSFPLNKWDKASIRPGPVGSVGDALTSVRIKQSMPDMPFAYDQTFNPSSDVLRGSNVQDGRWQSFTDKGYGAQVKRRKLENEPIKQAIGWRQQDIIRTDRTTDPILQDQPSHGFKSQIASILYRQGDMFQDLPKGYQPEQGVLLRGNMYPRNVGSAMGATPLPAKTEQLLSSIVQGSGMLIPPSLDSVVQSSRVATLLQPATPITPVQPPSRNRFGLRVDPQNLTPYNPSAYAIDNSIPSYNPPPYSPPSPWQLGWESTFQAPPPYVP